jgi:hypothetical protein
MARQDNARDHCLLSMRVPHELYALVAQDASQLGVSISDAARIRIRNGFVPTADSRKRKEESK